MRVTFLVRASCRMLQWNGRLLRAQVEPFMQGQSFALGHRHSSSKKSFEDTIKKMKEESNESKSSESENGPSSNHNETTGPTLADNIMIAARKIRDFAQLSVTFVRENLEQAWDELTGKTRESALKRTVKQADSFRRTPKESSGEGEEEVVDKYDGPTAIVLVKEPTSAWEQMKNRLQGSPLIKEILKTSLKMSKAAADTDIGKQAQKLGQSVKDKIEDAREFWETSQNPIVYTISGVIENLTGETEEAMTVAAIRKLDPKFMKEDWAHEVKTDLAPVLLKAHLTGDTRTLKAWCGEAVFEKLSADIRIRKKDGLTFDANILEIDEGRLILKLLEDRGPVIVAVYMVQQIHCVRNRAKEIVEGGENDIRAKYYSMAFHQEYNEDDGAVSWKLVDFEFAGEIPYI